MAFQYLSVSAWSSVAIWNENASLCLNAVPPLRPMQGMPNTVKSTVSTAPSLLDGLSLGARPILPTLVSGKVSA
ncbi:hypothetical protein D3C80_2111630 [compost metagenome]